MTIHFDEQLIVLLSERDSRIFRWCKRQYLKLETNILRKGIVRPQSQFLHSCGCKCFYIPRIVCLFCCRKICGPILGTYKSLTDTRVWKLGPLNFFSGNTYMGFSLQCGVFSPKIMTEHKTLGLQVKQVKTGWKTFKLIYRPTCKQRTCFPSWRWTVVPPTPWIGTLSRPSSDYSGNKSLYWKNRTKIFIMYTGILNGNTILVQPLWTEIGHLNNFSTFNALF